MNAENIDPADSEAPSVKEHEVCCPHLGTVVDAATRFAFATPGNRCHRASPPHPVALTHQQVVCSTQTYTACPVYAPSWSGAWPAELHNRAPVSRNGALFTPLLLLAGILFLVVLALAMPGIRQALLPVKPTSTAAMLLAFIGTPTALPPSSAPTSSPSATPTPSPQPSPATPTALPPTEAPAASQTPNPVSAATPTLTPTISEPTPGPAWGAPFGPENMLALHQVQTGESLHTLETLYQTDRSVIYAANDGLNPGRSIQPGEVLVVLPGRTDPTGTPRFRVIKTMRLTLITDLAAEYQVTVEDLRLYNTLGAGDWLPYGRWLVIPVSP